MNNKGFTLIEIIIVIVILGIMASLALPRITGQIDRGHLPAALEQIGKIQREMDQCMQLSTATTDCDSLSDVGYTEDSLVSNHWTYNADDESIWAVCEQATGGCSVEGTIIVNITMNASNGVDAGGVVVGTKEAQGSFAGFKFKS